MAILADVIEYLEDRQADARVARNNAKAALAVPELLPEDQRAQFALNGPGLVAKNDADMATLSGLLAVLRAIP
jgi:hypothetical protein